MGYRRAIGAGFDPRKAPAGGVALDRTHPLVRQMKLGILTAGAAGCMEFVTGTPGTVTDPNNMPARKVGPFGVGAGATGFGGYYWPTATLANAGADPRLTFFALLDYGGQGNNGEAPFLSYNPDDGQPAGWFNAEISSANTARIEVYSGGYSGVYGSTTINVGQSYGIGGQLTGVEENVWVNGVKDGASAYSSTPTAMAGNKFGILTHTGGRFFPGNVYCLYYWDRALSANDMAWLNAEPFAIFRPIVRRQYYAPTVATGAFTASISETAATSDTSTATLGATASRAETATTSDAPTAVLGATASRTESAATSDTPTSTLGATATRAETAASSDAATATLTATATVAEAATSSDAYTFTGQSLTQAESAATSDTYTATLGATATVAETAATSDAYTFVSPNPTRDETAATSDAYTATLGATATVGESAATSDALTAVLGATASRSETATTSDAYPSLAALIGSISEGATSLDTLTATMAAIATLAETAQTADRYARPGDFVADDFMFHPVF